jgi:hypothetical protein
LIQTRVKKPKQHSQKHTKSAKDNKRNNKSDTKLKENKIMIKQKYKMPSYDLKSSLNNRPWKKQFITNQPNAFHNITNIHKMIPQNLKNNMNHLTFLNKKFNKRVLSLSRKVAPKRLSFEKSFNFISSLKSFSLNKPFRFKIKSKHPQMSAKNSIKNNITSRSKSLQIKMKNINQNPFVPPFQFLKHPLFQDRYNPYQIFKHFFKPFISEVDCIKDVFCDLQILGKGSFAIVYQAHLKECQKPFALKFLSFKGLDRVSKLKRLMVGCLILIIVRWKSIFCRITARSICRNSINYFLIKKACILCYKKQEVSR